MRLKLFLMTRNEIGLIEDWLKYHGFLFGFENIYILDGSDDQRVFDIYKKYKPFGLHVKISSTGLNGLAGELTLLMHEEKGLNNFLIKLDTDEFLSYIPVSLGAEIIQGNSSLNKFLSVSNFSEFFEALPITGQRYQASFMTWSIPKHSHVDNPAIELIEFTPIQPINFKVFFHSESFLSVDLGAHVGESTNNEGFIYTGLSVIHFHSTSLDDSIRRARQVLISHGYIDALDSVEIQHDKLLKIQARGAVNSFHKISLYLLYLNEVLGGEPLRPEMLNFQHPWFRQNGPSSEMTLVRDTLNFIEKERHFVK
jgi:hypothetical protein